MVHPGGFEPPTARFVAEYSIQLSYGCIGKLALLRVSVTTNTCHTEYDGLIGRVTRLCLEPPTARFVAEYSIQLSYGCKMAVRRGFEPRMQLLTAYSLSRGAPSASRPPHHTRLFRVLRRTCFCSSSLRWRTYYFLVLISQTLFRDLFSFAHFARNSRAKTAKRAIYQQEISPDAGIMSNNQSGKG